MTLELNNDALEALTEEQLNDLVGRLAEAETVAGGGSVDEVRYGDIPNNGVDIRVDTNQPNLSSNFIPKPNTIFKCKNATMKPSCILNEMKPNGHLRPIISDQDKRNGAYVIVCIAHTCSEPMLNSRLKAMRDAVAGYKNIETGFIDLPKLHQWLNQHPKVMVWAREVLG